MLFMFALFNMSVLYKNRDRIDFPIASRIDVADRKIEEGWSARSQGIELREFVSVWNQDVDQEHFVSVIVRLSED